MNDFKKRVWSPEKAARTLCQKECLPWPSTTGDAIKEAIFDAFDDGHRAGLADRTSEIVSLLQAIVRVTPKEIAIRALKALGGDIPDPIKETLVVEPWQPSASRNPG